MNDLIKQVTDIGYYIVIAPDYTDQDVLAYKCGVLDGKNKISFHRDYDIDQCIIMACKKALGLDKIESK